MLIILFIFILIMSFFFGDSGIVEIVRVKEKIENLKTSVASLEKEKAALAEEVEKLQNNPLALERKAREKLWLMKKNEKVVVIIKNRNKNKEKIN
ncbi:MAG: septum formation initiator family protein, partial [Candidatus Aminicenantes bacterium]|nr:septum formation initiator family protein [Candidatus Aminicenantes bacterium]